MDQSEGRRPRHVTRSTEAKEEETKTYRVKEGQHWGTNPELQPGDTVELTEKEYTGFEDKLEPVGAEPKAAEPQAPAVPKKPAAS